MFTDPRSDRMPDWAKRAVFYHIYPLGFLDAPHQNPLEGDPIPRLEALRQWYDHFSDLGVTAIYFGPVFESHTHGYDTIDYFRIDRRLGDNHLFKQIVQELHARRIRVVLDGVFNHSGRGFFAFEDLRKNRRDSQYKDWFYVNWGADSGHKDGFAYKSWEGHESLPKLNTRNPEVREYIFEVARMWLGDIGVDGWRLDVAYEIEPDFWWEFRRVCHAANPETFLLAEVGGGDYRKWVAADLLDSGTNYQLYHPLIEAFNKLDFSILETAMERAHHPDFGVYRNLTLYNFIGNHDVSRVHSALENPRHFYTALLFLMAAPGIPGLYYGEEIGMTGVKGKHDDHAMRRPMPLPNQEWPDSERQIYPQVKRLIDIRKRHPALIYGRYATLKVEKTLFSFLRQHPRQTAIIILNGANQPVSTTIEITHEGIADGTVFRDVLNPENAPVSVQQSRLEIPKIWPGWGTILITGEE